ncbi:MAG: SIS domain-containing protein [Candidatus Kapabacteria bacterium]|nr:SIS domain-containing protein [Ignavibacteriota bacterium]MCW5883437.1 SIS domain-containing protein [Candidatus Kapabacteria bacterium]
MSNFQSKIKDTINLSISTKQDLLNQCSAEIENIGYKLAESIKNGGKIMFCGNGGSAADSQHLAAELVVRLRSHVNRPALPGIALTVDPSILTAGGNDIGFENIFARTVEAYGKSGDVLIGISTSGNSGNVMNAMTQAKEMGILCIGLLGAGGGKLLGMCDYSVVVPSNVTARVQESHILIGHIWCEMIEEILFPEYF